MSSNPQPRAWTHDDLEPGPNPDGNFPKVVDKYGVRWCADEREDGFEGWQSDSHGFRVWKTWFNLAFERGPLNEYVDTPQASSAERSEESLVSAVAESLRDFRFEVGPNTRDELAAGKTWVYLRPDERHRIAHAAVFAHKQVMADE